MKRSSILPIIALLVAVVAHLALDVPPLPRAHAGSSDGWQGFKAKTADYTCVASENGTIFTNRGASAPANGITGYTYTLPAPFADGHFRFRGVAAVTFTVAVATADTLIGLHDVDLDSIALATPGEIIGGEIEVISDGTSWIGFVRTVGHTVTRND